MISEQQGAPALLTVIHELLDYCRRNYWAGFDPYDALNSRLFQATPLRHSRIARLGLTQFVKRCPINLRPLLGVPQMQNPKGIALFCSSAIKLARLGMAEKQLGHLLAHRLLEHRSPGYAETCWGYHFDWQNRHFLQPKYEPNIICSTFGGNALLDAYEHFGDPQFLEAASSVARFVLDRLNRTQSDDTFCFSYTPRDHGQVHNANLLGAAFLARLWQLRPDDVLRSAAVASARYTVDRQKAEGSWLYGESPNQAWVDGFHTGYILVALQRLHAAFRLPWLEESMQLGYAFFRQHFFASGGVPKYYHDRVYPIDIHSAAQSVITLVAFSGSDPTALPLATSVLEWTNRHMRSSRGYYYFQKHRLWTNPTSYIRWSQAWMLLALVTLEESAQGGKNNLARLQDANLIHAP